jgi:branched-chain amino acid transport system substrate-binding protein
MKLKKILWYVGFMTLCTPSFSQVPGISNTEIHLGQTADFSASRAAISKAYSQGAMLYFDKINQQGGVLGRTIKLTQLDDKYQTKLALENTQKLIDEEKVFSLVHGLGTGIAEAVVPYVEERGVPYIHPLTGADHLRKAPYLGKQTFYLRSTYGNEVQRITKQLSTIGITRIAFVHEDEPFGIGVKALVIQALGDANLKLSSVGVLPFNKPDDVQAAVQVVSNEQPQAIIVGSAGGSVVNFIKSYLAAGHTAQFYGLSVSNPVQLFKVLGPSSKNLILAQVMPSVERSAMPIVQQYRNAVSKTKPAQVANNFGLEGYISAQIIVQALRASGKNITRKKFVRALESVGAASIGGFPLRYSAVERSGSNWVDIGIIGFDGKLVY